LETVAGGRALSQQIKQLEDGRGKSSKADAAWLFALARRGHVPAKKILEQMTEALGVAIATVINLFDPGCVILNGQLILADDYLVAGIHQAVHKHALRVRFLNGDSKNKSRFVQRSVGRGDAADAELFPNG
jgi:predicted NBD/HSP70 family sugar kinase